MAGYNIEEPIFGTNAHNVTVKGMDYTADGSLTSQTIHGLTVAVDGKVIGRISSWQPQPGTRAGEHVYELSYHTFGRPVEWVPGKVEGYTVSATRAEIWSGEFEKVVGFSGQPFDDLADQDRPFVADEYLLKGPGTIYRWIKYTGCWFTTLDQDPMTVDDPSLKVNAEIAYVSRRYVVYNG